MHALRELSTDELHACPSEGVLVIGSAENAQIRLQAKGVVAEHVRINCQRSDSGRRWLKIRAVHAGVFLNGEPIERGVMQIGDELEIAGCRLRFEEIQLEAAAPVSRVRRSPRSSLGFSKTLLWVIGSGLILMISTMVWTRSQDVLPSNWLEVRQLYERTRFASADQLLDQFRQDWSAGDPEREAIIATERQRMRLYATLLEQGRQRMIAAAPSTTPAAQIRALKAQRKSKDPLAQKVASLLLSELTELRLQGNSRHDLEAAARWLAILAAKAEASAAAKSAEERAAAQQEFLEARRMAVATEEQGGLVVEPAEQQEAERGMEFHALAEEALAQSHYSKAAEIFTESLLDADEEQVAVVAEGLARVMDSAGDRLLEVVDEAKTMAMMHSHQSVEKARTMIVEALEHVPDSSSLRDARHAAGLLVADLARRSATMPDPGQIFTPLQRKQAQGREYEQAGRYREASQLYQESSSLAAAEQPFLSSYLAGKAWDCSLIAELCELIAHRLTGAPARSVSLENGRLVEIHDLKAGVLVSSEGEELTFGELAASGLEKLLEGLKLSPRLDLAAGLLGYQRDDWSQAEARIKKALEADPSLSGTIAGVIARGRDELVGDWSYRLVDGEFVKAAASVDRRLLEELASGVGSRRASNVEDWQRTVEEILSAGPASIEPLIVALRAQVREDLGRVRKHAFRKAWQQTREKRLALDRARNIALQLIFAEEEYFYPCQLPAVSKSRRREYQSVQVEVERRVEAVRSLWDQEAAGLRANPELQRQMAKIEWMISQIEFLGESSADLRRQIAWWQSLPQEGEVSLRRFSHGYEERVAREGYAETRSHNLQLMAEIDAAEAEQIKATNDYREMFGLAPLAFDLRLYRACQGHAQEMEQVGYFSHFSPDPDKRTVFDRANRAGYLAVSSENIIHCDNAEDALTLWTQSSAQHRNLLALAHRDIAVARQGMNWVQEFGRGMQQ